MPWRRVGRLSFAEPAMSLLSRRTRFHQSVFSRVPACSCGIDRLFSFTIKHLDFQCRTHGVVRTIFDDPDNENLINRQTPCYSAHWQWWKIGRQNVNRLLEANRNYTRRNRRRNVAGRLRNGLISIQRDGYLKKRQAQKYFL